MEDLPQKFFDLEAPCPDEIINCEEMRKMYIGEKQHYESQNMCNSCAMRSLRNKYITIILSNIKQK